MLYTKCNSYNPYVSLLVGRSACRHNFLKGREVQTRIQRCAIMALSSCLSFIFCAQITNYKTDMVPSGLYKLKIERYILSRGAKKVADDR